MIKYKYVPKKGIKTAKQLLKFVQSIPADLWCVDARDDDQGHHCVLGHLDNAFSELGWAGKNTDGFTQQELAVANNGVVGPDANTSPRIEGAGLDGESIKNRVIELIKTKC